MDAWQETQSIADLELTHADHTSTHSINQLCGKATTYTYRHHNRGIVQPECCISKCFCTRMELMEVWWKHIMFSNNDGADGRMSSRLEDADLNRLRDGMSAHMIQQC